MKIVIFFFCLFFALNSYGQESTFLDYDYVCELSRTYIKPTTHAKRLRLSSRCGGCIDLDISDCKDMPDSLFVAITKVKEVWENYLPFGASVNVKIRYVDLGDTDIKTSVDHDLMLEDNLYYPSCLYRKLVNQSVEKKEGSRKIDALISINSKTNWAVGFTKSDIPNKNLAYSLLKQFAVVLGFGTSIKCDKRGAFNFGFTRGQSVFDSYLFPFQRALNCISSHNHFSVSLLGYIYSSFFKFKFFYIFKYVFWNIWLYSQCITRL
jgi:hypothetical protein